MDILVEVLLQIVGFVFQAFFELLVQLVFEALFELGARGVRDVVKRPPSRAMAVAGYLVLGGIAGCISLWVFPNLFIGPVWGRWLNLVLTPLAAGAAMAGLGWLRRKKGQPLVRLDTFGYGFLFAFAMAAVRFLGGK